MLYTWTYNKYDIYCKIMIEYLVIVVILLPIWPLKTILKKQLFAQQRILNKEGTLKEICIFHHVIAKALVVSPCSKVNEDILSYVASDCNAILC